MIISIGKCYTHGRQNVGGHSVVLVVELLEPEEDVLVTLGGIPTLSPAGSQEGEHDNVQLHYSLKHYTGGTLSN